MITYRAETTLVNLIKPDYANNDKDGRTLVKEIFTSPADIYSDYEDKTVTVTLHALSSPGRNKAAKHLCQILTDTQSLYPGTVFTMIFKSIAVWFK